MADYQVMPPLSTEEYEALKADIDKRGVLVPIEVDADTGDVLDGFHRLQIANELNKEVPVIERHFASDEERKEHALMLNLLRRHLGPISWAEAFKKLAETRGVPLGTQGGRLSIVEKSENNPPTVGGLSNEVGVPYTTAKNRLKLADDLANHPDLAEAVDRKDMPAKTARRKAREREAKERNSNLLPTSKLPPSVDVRHCDFRDLDLAANSADLIFTDPPYAKKYLPLWSDLSLFAAHTLKDGGLLIAYTGQYYLLEVMNRLTEHLEYVWLGAIKTHGPKHINHPRKMYAKCKPLLFYSKGDYAPSNFVDDFIDDDKPEKDAHEWQQGIKPALYYIELLTPEGGTVVDPFLGTGTTGVAALKLGRSFIGAEKERKTYRDAKERIAKEIA